MTVDFAALAGSVGALPGVRVCVVLSREGLALASSPEADELGAMSAWGRLGSLGEVEKGFVSMSGEMWVFCRRGPFAALAVADPSARPGVILTQLEQALLAADEDRTRTREEMRSAGSRPAAQPESQQAPRFRAPLHRAPATAGPDAGGEAPATPAPRGKSAEGKSDEEWVDVVELSREFGGLYGADDERPER